MDTLFDRVGGEPFFVDLVDRFYLGVAGDPLLRPLYPDDLSESSRHLALFLMQYWGGPGTYGEERGHPGCACATPPSSSARPSVTPGCATCSVHSSSCEWPARISAADAVELRDYLEMAANSLVNSPDR